MILKLLFLFQGTGKPTPKLTWTKDGDVIKESEHYVLVQDSQYLLILDTKMDDDGYYVCELTNILGTVRGQIKLSIKRGKFRQIFNLK